MELFAFILHLLLDFSIGIGVLIILNLLDGLYGSFFIALLLGFFFETMIGFLVMLSGGTIKFTLILLIIFTLAINVYNYIKYRITYLQYFKLPLSAITNFKWYEVILIALILQKISMGLWQLYRMPTFYSDSIKHWSTQARAIYANVNWSLQSDSFNFLTKKLTLVSDYPLQLPIWRAISAVFNGEWNEFVSRSDGLLFLIIICGIMTTTTWQLTKQRWIALGSTLIVASLPLQVWHAAAGYADIVVEAYILAAIAMFINRKWWLVGVFMAGAIWSKNDGLALYLPGILLAMLMYHFITKEQDFKVGLKKLSYFMLGIIVVTPWLVFQAIHSHSVFSKIINPIKSLFSDTYLQNDYYPLLTQTGPKFKDHPDSLSLFWDYVIIGPTHGIFWIAVIVLFLFLSPKLFSDRLGRSLAAFFFTCILLIYYIFTYTPAYEFLFIQTTIHRTLLQFSAATMLIIGYGISLSLPKHKNIKG